MNSFLIAFRKINGLICWRRDEGRCQMCGKVAGETDHVFGRGTMKSLHLEHWALRMTICSKCHHQKHHGHGFDREKQLKKMDDTNKIFSMQDRELLEWHALSLIPDKVRYEAQVELRDQRDTAQSLLAVKLGQK